MKKYRIERDCEMCIGCTFYVEKRRRFLFIFPYWETVAFFFDENKAIKLYKLLTTQQ